MAAGFGWGVPLLLAERKVVCRYSIPRGRTQLDTKPQAIEFALFHTPPSSTVISRGSAHYIHCSYHDTVKWEACIWVVEFQEGRGVADGTTLVNKGK